MITELGKDRRIRELHLTLRTVVLEVEAFLEGVHLIVRDKSLTPEQMAKQMDNLAHNLELKKESAREIVLSCLAGTSRHQRIEDGGESEDPQ